MRTFHLAAAVAAVFLSAGAASAQVTPQAVSGWLSGQDLTAELVTEGEDPFIRVREEGLTWLLFFYGCEADGCDSLQFGAGFTNEEITVESVNAWNRDRRFLKAYFEAGAEGSAIVQYDVIPTRGAPMDHLGDHVELWRNFLNAFAVHVGYFEAASGTAQ
ncbi:MAG: YbjN domain-containing protein [Brevundimonas sp.]|uniref:YbjN domain-containing protein n=1 Tax=Brevundimonas sp. TaxID=1871086 RepID=UPI00391BF3A4